MLPHSCVVQRLVQHDLNVIFPHEDEIERLHRIIIDELSNNIFTEESKQFYINVIQRLFDEHQVEGVVLGCTGKKIFSNDSLVKYLFLEIPILIKQNDIPHVPLFDSTKLHVNITRNLN